MFVIKSLSQTKRNDVVFINKIIGNSKLKYRIMEMGLTKGTKILIKNFAPFKDPIEIAIRGYRLSVRKTEAEKILVSYLI